MEPELGALAGAHVLLMAVIGRTGAKVVDPLALKVQERAASRPRPVSSA